MMLLSTVQVVALVFASAALLVLLAVVVVWDDARRDGRANVEAFRAGYTEGIRTSGPPLADDPPAPPASGPDDTITMSAVTDDFPVLPAAEDAFGPAEVAGKLQVVGESLSAAREHVHAAEDDLQFIAETLLRRSQGG